MTVDEEARQMCIFIHETTADAARKMLSDLCTVTSILMTVLRTSLLAPPLFDGEEAEHSREAICEAELARCRQDGIDEKMRRDIPDRCADIAGWRPPDCTVSFDEVKDCLAAWHQVRNDDLRAAAAELPDCGEMDRWLSNGNVIPERTPDGPVPVQCQAIVHRCPVSAQPIGLTDLPKIFEPSR